MQVFHVGQEVPFEYQGQSLQVSVRSILVHDLLGGVQQSVERGMVTPDTACTFDAAAPSGIKVRCHRVPLLPLRAAMFHFASNQQARFCYGILGQSGAESRSLSESQQLPNLVVICTIYEIGLTELSTWRWLMAHGSRTQILKYTKLYKRYVIIIYSSPESAGPLVGAAGEGPEEFHCSTATVQEQRFQFRESWDRWVGQSV